jgi:hypothetical protein
MGLLERDEVLQRSMTGASTAPSQSLTDDFNTVNE